MERNSPKVDKIVFFVRHGQTEANIADTIQGLDDPLTAHGEMQAERIAERAQNIEFETLIASDAVRAQQTARAIARVTSKAIESSELFREIRRPSAFFGTPRLTNEFQEFDQEWWKHRSEDWHHSDEESALDFLERGQRALEYLANRPERSLLVVTHGYFLRALAARVLSASEDDIEPMLRILKNLIGDNTGITIFLRKENTWRLLTWNDHAHLG